MLLFFWREQAAAGAVVSLPDPIWATGSMDTARWAAFLRSIEVDADEKVLKPRRRRKPRRKEAPGAPLPGIMEAVDVATQLAMLPDEAEQALRKRVVERAIDDAKVASAWLAFYVAKLQEEQLKREEDELAAILLMAA